MKKHIWNFKNVSDALHTIMSSPVIACIEGNTYFNNLEDNTLVKIKEIDGELLFTDILLLTFTADGEDSTISLRNVGGNAPVIYYSFDNKEWTRWNYDLELISLLNGQSVYMYGDNPTGFSHSNSLYSLFVMTGKIAASGNILSLISKDMPNKIPCDCCYLLMFRDCTSLTQAPELPATKLTDYCYRNMFLGCTSLTQAPELPATTLASNCYSHMLFGCTSLTQVHELPATTLVDNCYSYMFYGCTSLTQAPELPATTLAELCYLLMFRDCTSLTQAPELPATRLTYMCYYLMFCNCTSLTQAPELPATTFALSCYSNMFYKCTSLTQAPELPATTLALYCYGYMFAGCTSLTQVPELPATTLRDGCYRYMFYGCTSLTQAPELLATTLASECYREMFRSCTSLTQAPELPATTLASYCYHGMFRDCTSLTQAPELPATRLTDGCYYYMFLDCTSLSQAPELPATTLAIRCYNGMFSGCTKLSKITTYATSWNTTHTTDWLSNVSESGTFYNLGDANIPTGTDGIPTGWNVVLPYLCFTADGEDSTISLSNNGDNAPVIYYSFDNVEWTKWNYDLISLLNGQSVYMYGDNPTGVNHSGILYSKFVMTGKIATSGNILSLIGKDMPNEIPCGFCYYRMFYGCTSLTQAPELPATALANSCYSGMFYGCTSLTQAPELPATTLAQHCYSGMFNGCTGLTSIDLNNIKPLMKENYKYVYGACSLMFGNTGVETLIIPANYVIPTAMFRIESTADYATSKLKKVIFEGDVTMGYNVFGECYNLTEIEYHSLNTPERDQNATVNTNIWTSTIVANSTGYTTRANGTNVFKCPSNSTYTEQQLDDCDTMCLFDTERCGFHIERSLAAI